MKKYFNLIKCPLCQSKSYKILYKSTLTARDFKYSTLVKNVANTTEDYTKHSQIVKCTVCQLVYANPREDIFKLVKAYSDVIDEEYLKTERYRKILLSDHLEYLKKYKKGRKILDIGSFAGYFLELAKNSGWETFGIEPSAWALRIARKKGIRNLGSDIYKVKLKSNFFDVITLLDVIEHLHDPRRLIKIISKALADDGILVIATPNIDSLYAKLLGARCPFFIRMHIVLYSPKTLQVLLEKEGFKIVGISYYGRTYPIWYFLDRLQIKNKRAKKVLGLIRKMPFISKITITHNFRDSFRIVAIKV